MSNCGCSQISTPPSVGCAPSIPQPAQVVVPCPIPTCIQVVNPSPCCGSTQLPCFPAGVSGYTPDDFRNRWNF